MWDKKENGNTIYDSNVGGTEKLTRNVRKDIGRGREEWIKKLNNTRDKGETEERGRERKERGERGRRVR